MLNIPSSKNKFLNLVGVKPRFLSGKKKILILLMAISFGAIAQKTPAVPAKQGTSATPAMPPAPPTPPEPPRKEKVESMRIGFLTQKLDLSPEEAQKFWPVYNELQKKRDALHQNKKEEKKSIKANIDSLSDRQVEAIVDAEIAFREKNLDLEKEYHVKFKSVLPIKKVAKLYRAEEQFTHRLLDQISERGKVGGHGGKKSGMPPHHAAPPDIQGDN